MIYADYEYYTNAYLGQIISEFDFPRLSLRASAYLDYCTLGRASRNADLGALKMACCALAEQYQMIETAQQAANKSISAALETGGGEVQSETVGSWSRSFRSGGDTAKTVLTAAQTGQASLSSVAAQYLTGTGLLYRGRCCHK